MLTVALVGAALVAGAAGTWSPCALSAVDTLRAARPRGGSVARACASFAVGTSFGGAATFGTLAAVGAVLGLAPVTAAAVVAVAVLAAVAELRGVRVVPQVRRQVPEPWRRTLPPSVAAGAYGFLLGLGFATFVLTFAFWALAAAVLVAGDVLLGVAAGVAFGLGRSLPIVALTADRSDRILDALTERPRLLRGWRAACALTLVGVAVAAWP